MNGSIVTKILAPLVVAALVVAAGIYLLTSGEDDKRLTAHFPRTVSVYEGSEVRVLGVPVGTVEKVTPSGTDVVVEMAYDSEVDVPSSAKAAIVAPSVVGDRYIQLTPAYKDGPVLEDGAELEEDRTAVPLELDQIYESMDELVVALGPKGANKNGALSDLLKQTARNFGGQGEQVNQTIKDVAKVSKTLDDNADQFFGSAEQLQKFVSTLAENDTTVRRFARSLEDVSGMLASERKDLAAALKNLGTTLGDVTTFVRENKDSLRTNIKGLNRVAGLLVKQRDSLEETLKVAPLALNNLFHAYNPDTGTMDTNANLGKLIDNIVSNPGQVLCELVQQTNDGATDCSMFENLVPRGQVFGQGTGTSYESPHDPTLGGLVPSAGSTGPTDEEDAR